MKEEHKATREVVKQFQKNGIPMAVRKEEKWVAILPKDSSVVSFELTSSRLQNEEETTPTAPLRSIEESPREALI